MNEERAIEMFHAMWDNFPARARLIRKDRTVLAVNKFAANEGFVPGERCCDRPPLEGHRHCLANQALADREGKIRLVPGGKMIYWAPLEGFEDLYVHGNLEPKNIAE